jgi:hypothetical protein
MLFLLIFKLFFLDSTLLIIFSFRKVKNFHDFRPGYPFIDFTKRPIYNLIKPSKPFDNKHSGQSFQFGY